MSHNIWKSNITYFTAVDSIMYSDSVVDVYTEYHLLVFHVMSPLDNRKTYPVVDLLLSTSPAKSASEQGTRQGLSDPGLY